MKQIIFTCDDCGLSRGINYATARLYERGMITAASVITNLPATQHAFEVFARYPDLEVGIHLNLSDGFPLTRPPSPSSLTRSNGRFHPPLLSTLRTYTPTARYMRLFEAEMRAQLDVFTEAGLRPGHLTTHRHFHASPMLRKVIVNLAQEYEIPWLRAYRLAAMAVPGNLFHEEGLIEQEHEPVIVPDHLVSIKAWMHREPEPFFDAMSTLEGVIEFVLHPCTAEDDTYPDYAEYKPEDRYREQQYFERAYELWQVWQRDVGSEKLKAESLRLKKESEELKEKSLKLKVGSEEIEV